MDDPRCCGTGTCIINAEGFCWCGQRWDGERMCFPGESGQAPARDQRENALTPATQGSDHGNRPRPSSAPPPEVAT